MQILATSTYMYTNQNGITHAQLMVTSADYSAYVQEGLCLAGPSSLARFALLRSSPYEYFKTISLISRSKLIIIPLILPSAY